VSGDIIIIGSGNAPIQHNGIYLSLDGIVNINLSTKNVGVFEAFYNSAKVSHVLNKKNRFMQLINKNSRFSSIKADSDDKLLA
jgi:hypothetical protein